MLQQTQNYYRFSANTLINQSILDIFVIQDIIDSSDAVKLAARYKTNKEVEDFLVKNRIVSRDTINKAYSILLKLPYVEIKNLEIPQNVLSMIPEKTVKKFGFLPFYFEDGIVRVAVSRPSDLLVGYEQGIAKIFKNKDVEVEIFITGESDFAEAIKQFSRNYDKSLLLKKGSYPIVYLRNQIIPAEFLKKIPKEFIQKYRLVVFGQNMKGYYQLACEEPDSIVTRKIIDFIRRENKIKTEIYATSKDDIDFVLGQCERKSSSEAENTTILPQKEETKPLNQSDQGIEKPAENLLQTNKQEALSAEENLVNQPDASEYKNSGLKSILSSLMETRDPQVTIDEVEGQAQDNLEEGNTESKNNVPSTVSSGEAEKKDNATNPVVPKEDAEKPMPKSANEKFIETPSVQKSEDKVSVESALETNNLGALLNKEIKTEADLNDIVKEANVPKIVAGVIDYALNNRSSDIHIEPGEKILRMRCRVDGILTDVVKVDLKMHPPLISRIKIMSRMKIDETRIPQDGRFNVLFKRGEVDVRVSTLPTVHGEKVVMRILDKSQGILSLEDLGMTGSAFKLTSEAIKNPYGIILSTGPTGSGKSTTLYAVLNRISVPGVNIVTLEDPVEYEIAGINQCQIKPEIGFTFAAGLRSILRQDPNVIMVGEIRDAETASMATHAALTGHLVLSTLHTNDTAGALPRLINMGVEPFLITSSINLVIAQRLVRRICPKCREEMKVPQKLMDQLKAELEMIPVSNKIDRDRIPQDWRLYYGKGCPECSHGFKGRVGIYEVMAISDEIEELAVAKRPANDIKNQALKEGMITMKQDGILKSFAGLTTVDEVFQAVINN